MRQDELDRKKPRPKAKKTGKNLHVPADLRALGITNMQAFFEPVKQ